MKIKVTEKIFKLLNKLYIYKLSFQIHNPMKSEKRISDILEKFVVLETTDINKFLTVIRVILNSNLKRVFSYRISFCYKDKPCEIQHAFYSKEDKNIWMCEFEEVLKQIDSFTR